jgi:hypothetical protein
MTTSNNLSSDLSNLTASVRKDIDSYFNNLYQPKLALPIDSDGAIQSFFESVTKDKESARLLTYAVVYTSLASNNNPMKVLADFKKLPPGQLDLYLATFLNLNRVNTSLLGISNQPKTSYFVQRAILP